LPPFFALLLFVGGCASTWPIDCRTFDRDNDQAWATCMAGHKPGRHKPAELIMPDLAGEALFRVVSPTMLIVGESDEVILRLNEEALGKLQCMKELKIVPDATRLFEEPGKLEEIARLLDSN